jgi:hypothetical protein
MRLKVGKRNSNSKGGNMQVLTMTRIVGDVDTVALMEYAESENRHQYLNDFCRENYGEVPLHVRMMVGRAFREAADMHSISLRPKRNRDYFSIGLDNY